MALDPSRNAARVTREVAAHLAELSKSLEENGYEPERTAHFLMRCIFTMFAEDVELIPKDGFRDVLKQFTLHTPADSRLPTAAFTDMVRDIWRAMDTGNFSVNLKQKLQRFNGGLFTDTEVLPLNENQITMLYNAAACEWRDVEPAIFGTLLDRALNAKERHKLGAHYTPRAYVERLVLPTVIEPLREDWDSVLAAAVMLDGEGKWKQAVQECRDFLYRLTQTLVLDPACGTGNFLYVTLDHMKRLEGEVRNAMASFTGSHQAEIEASEFQVDPHQFLGIEVNPRAAAIAELVLWIGYLQWQIKALGTTRLPEPVLRAYHNIECRDAVLS
jgi:type I restriction-modification system DNA methylase subunit